jgi:tetratricopeptide (TPR) repeat protein
MRREVFPLVILGLVAACKATHPGPYAPLEDVERDTAKAEKLTREAADWISQDLQVADDLLREALTADLYHGPAHNNLGVVFLKQGKLYEAANEFEWARKLMPGNPDPRLNLALTLERAGHVEEALKAYNAALEVAPEYMPAIQGFARLNLRTGRQDHRLRELLDVIALRGETHQWRQWARGQMIHMQE